MQELTSAPQMASPYTPAGGSNLPTTAPQPPKLGAPIPGMTGGLPAKPGLTVYDTPLSQSLQSQPQQAAQHTQSYGRGQDTMLVHMTPDEVNSLRGLAQQFGGDLTQNPHTGLPEAGWLGKLLPTILGGIGMAFGIPPVWMGALGAVGGTAITGSLKEGLMAGLGAYGGASMAGGLGLGSKISSIGTALPGGQAAVMNAGATGAANAGKLGAAAKEAGTAVAKTAGTGLPAVSGAPVAGAVAKEAGAAVAKQAASSGLGAIGQNFASAAKAGLPGGIIGKAAPYVAGMGVLNSVSNALTPTPKAPGKEVDEYGYTGPYEAHRQQFTPVGAPSLDTTTPFDPTNFDSSQKQWFGPVSYTDASGKAYIPGQKTTPTSANVSSPTANPIRLTPEQRMQMFGYAHGGPVHMDEGSFVMPARETAEFGKGSTDAGQRVLKGLGGIPIKGPGDGTSDSIPARIGGKQEARIADGEVYFPASAVKRIGKGDPKRGTQKLYAMMKKAEQSRKKASRGGDGANLMRGLA